MIYFLLLGLIFVIMPFGDNQFELPKVLAAIVSLTLLFLLTLPRLFAKPWKINLRIICFIVLIAIALFHLFFPTYPDNLLLGNTWRPHGTILYLNLFLLFFIAPKLPFNKATVAKFSLCSLPVLLVSTLLIGSKNSWRFIGPLGESTALGSVVLFLFPFTALLQRKYQISSLILSFVLILLSGSRMALVGLLAEIILLYLPHHKKLFKTGLVGLGTLLIFSLITPFLPRQLPAEYFLRFENRNEIWAVSYSAAFKSPLLGNGFGSVQDVIREQAWKDNNFIRFQSVDHAHNLFLNWWLMSGAVGTLILLVIIITSLKNLIASRSQILLSILIGLLIIQSFNPVSVVSLVHFWWLLGITFSSSEKSKGEFGAGLHIRPFGAIYLPSKTSISI